MNHSSNVRVNEAKASHILELPGTLRVAEKLLLGYFAYAAIASLAFPLSLRERLAILGLNLTAGSALFLLSRLSEGERSAWLSTVRDWMPCVLILLAYRESGLFIVPDPTHRLDYLFVRWDAVLLKNPWTLGLLSFFSPWLQRYLEFSYFLCYPLVPLGLAGLHLARRWRAFEDRSTARGQLSIDDFWTTVLLAVLTCYAVFPLFPLTPPRVLFHDLPGPAVQPFLRKMNFWVLDQYSVQASIFPSGHVAAVTATALAVRARLPRVGYVFLLAALSVAAATVYGRYHYAADAVAGALVGIAAFIVSRRIHERQGHL